MPSILKKLRYIYLPFLAILVGTIAIYTGLHWLLFIKLNLFSLQEDVVNFWLPFAVPWIPVLLWLRPRIRLLKTNDRIPFLYQMVAAFAISVPMINAQGYLETACGKLTKLENINQIDQLETSKYYQLKNYHIDKWHIGVYPSFEYSGRYNEHLDMRIHVVLPIWESVADTNKKQCSGWLGMEYYKQISSRLSDEEKEAEYTTFAAESQIDFEKKDVHHFSYFTRAENSSDGIDYKAAIKAYGLIQGGENNIFVATNEPFEARFGNGLYWFYLTLGIGCGVWLLMLLIPKLDTDELQLFESGQSSGDGSEEEIMSLLKPQGDYFITPLIIYLNVGMFLVMVFAGLGLVSFRGEDLIDWGANYGPLTKAGQWWRLITSTFLHGGIMHLVANMYGLFFVGIFLEPLLGRIKYALVYLITGVLASCASFWWYDATVSVGASGAIFGLYGIFLFLLVAKIYPPDFAKTFLISTLVFVGFNLFAGIADGIDNAAHIGGLASGFLCGLLLYPFIKKPAGKLIDDEGQSGDG